MCPTSQGVAAPTAQDETTKGAVKMETDAAMWTLLGALVIVMVVFAFGD